MSHESVGTASTYPVGDLNEPVESLRLGLIGGALDSAIGRSHHIASQMDNIWKIVCGCFSISEAANLLTAQSLNVPPSRTYKDWPQMLEAERGSLDAICLLTPTPSHAEIGKAALEMGYAVVSEKALAATVAEADELLSTIEATRGFCSVTYNYSGYPMVRELRQMISNGDLGEIHSVQAEMPQEGFLRLVGSQRELPKPQAWRLQDGEIPTVSLDLGVHLHHLIYFLIRESPLEVCAIEQQSGHFNGIVDTVLCLARYTGDVSAQIWYGKAALGYSNGLRIRVFGKLGSAEWVQTNPETLSYHDNMGQTRLITRSSSTAIVCNQERYGRFRPGHPAGFLEAFANYYHDVADSLRAFRKGQNLNEMVAGADLAREGLAMMQAITLSAGGRGWRTVEGRSKN